MRNAPKVVLSLRADEVLPSTDNFLYQEFRSLTYRKKPSNVSIHLGPPLFLRSRAVNHRLGKILPFARAQTGTCQPTMTTLFPDGLCTLLTTGLYVRILLGSLKLHAATPVLESCSLLQTTISAALNVRCTNVKTGTTPTVGCPVLKIRRVREAASN